ncbi:MAG: hypothetical protein FWG73_06325 [Planctomycetaceae bacterium]|nr:hypothetical protein [Planctomycetaceae bacterium]
MEPTPDEALLIAYLDGEITPQDREALEQRLAEEPELQEKLTLLGETWNYLELLEKEDADAVQIETTLKTVALSLSIAHVPALQKKPAKQWAVFAIVGLAIFFIFLQVGLRTSFDDPSFRRKLERLDMYLAITNDDDGLELLQKLTAKRVFLPALPDAELPDASEFKPSFRIRMSNAWNRSTGSFWNGADTELNQLFYRNLQPYRLLSREKRSQIRTLHRNIEASPRQAELLLTLQNYYHWRQSLQSYEKIALRQPKPLSERVSDIVELKTRLDGLSPETGIWLPSEVVGIEESRRLAAILAELPLEHQERLLNEGPILMIDELRRLQ